jgi:disulfide bond formation protein DsbB
MQKYGLYYCWVVACIATLASLYFSDVRNLEPCHLCWYQRIAIYPLVIFLGIAAWRQFFKIIPFVLPLVLVGLLISIYQVLIQEIPGWQPIEICGAGPSCTSKVVIGLGFLTIPMLAVLGFLILTILLIWTWKSREPKD